MAKTLQQAVHTLAVFAVLLHVGGGCCLHHSHGAGSSDDAMDTCCAARQNDEHHCPRNCGGEGDPEGTVSGKGMPLDRCGMESCAFAVPGSSSAGVKASLEAPVDAPAVLSLAHPWPKRDVAPAREPPPLFRSGLRLHLLKQVLLL
jgi:hypothetical protein